MSKQVYVIMGTTDTQQTEVVAVRSTPKAAKAVAQLVASRYAFVEIEGPHEVDGPIMATDGQRALKFDSPSR